MPASPRRAASISALTGLVKTGAETEPVKQEPYGAYHFVRVAGPTPDSDDVYSAFKAGWAKPTRYIDEEPQWAAPSQTGSADAEATFYGDRIRAEITSAGADTLVLDRSVPDPVDRPVFLEPESALALYDPGARALEFVVGVQSPHWIATNIASLVAHNAPDYAVKDIVAHCAYVGGGFGGRDFSIFPLYAAIAALFSPGKPVRLANHRYDQFQFGLKRHAFTIRSRIAVDKASGKITAFASDQDLDGGGLANLSEPVALVGAAATIGMYDVPKVDVHVGRPPQPCRHRRLDARLRRLPDHDRARGADRRDGGEPRARSGRIPPAQSACERRQDHARQRRSPAMSGAPRCSTGSPRSRSGPTAPPRRRGAPRRRRTSSTASACPA